MNPIKVLFFAICCCVLAPVQAQGLTGDKGKREVLMMGLYPPDIIMRHQQKLGITDGQRTTISKAVQKFQSDVAELQWTLQNDQQLLQQSLGEFPIKTEAALTQAAQVLALESKFKQAHFELLIAIKNTLTEEQIAKINSAISQKREKLEP